MNIQDNIYIYVYIYNIKELKTTSIVSQVKSTFNQENKFSAPGLWISSINVSSKEKVKLR